jgi:hypothetical protein
MGEPLPMAHSVRAGKRRRPSGARGPGGFLAWLCIGSDPCRPARCACGAGRSRAAPGAWSPTARPIRCNQLLCCACRTEICLFKALRRPGPRCPAGARPVAPLDPGPRAPSRAGSFRPGPSLAHVCCLVLSAHTPTRQGGPDERQKGDGGARPPPPARRALRPGPSAPRRAAPPSEAPRRQVSLDVEEYEEAAATFGFGRVPGDDGSPSTHPARRGSPHRVG